MSRVRARLRDERGMTLAEMLVATTVMLAVVGATLAVFGTLESTARVNQVQNEAQDRARTVIDTLARELRNLASPTPQQPEAVEKATGYDLVFQTVDPVGPNTGANAPNVRRVRYCLDSTTRKDGNELWVQTQTWTTAAIPPAPSTALCPDPAWPTKRIVTPHVANKVRGSNAGVFRYNASSPAAITAIQLILWIDVDSTAKPGASRLASGVFLRNQNRRPVAGFTATPAGSNNHVVLNGWSSQDPEGDTLTYTWYADGVEICQGAGVVCDYTASAPGPHTFTLKVTDSGGLEHTAEAKVVTVT